MLAKTKKVSPATDGFNKDYIKLIYSTLPQKLARQQVAFVIKKLGLKKGMSILDIGCGNGRHSLEFARRGYRVTGIDSSKDLITFARKSARKEKLRIEFAQKDMVALPFTDKFDAAISIYSFGFLKRRGDHKIAIANIARSLKTGGKFLLITGNSLLKLKEAKISFTKNRDIKLFTHTSEKTLDTGIVVTTKETINTTSMKQVIKSTWKEKRGMRALISTMHLFKPVEIKKILTEHGLHIISVNSDFDSSPFLLNSKKLIISAVKK